MLALACCLVACRAPAAPGSDASTSTVDARTLDAPVLDAPGLDAPTFDAAVTDAPTADAPTSTIDASTMDGSVPDANTPCSTDADCPGPHRVCDDGIQPSTCACACGYTLDQSGACVWTGLLVNPTFSDTTGWTGGTPDPTDTQAGLEDPGTVHVVIPDSLTQDYCMPRRSRAEPLVISVSYQNRDYFVTPAFGLGTTWHYDLTSMGTAWQVERRCLGEADYAPESSTGRGAPQTLTFVSYPYAGVDGVNPVGYDLDHVEILPAAPGECPAPGTVLNGDGESDGGWVTTAPADEFYFDPGAGENGTRGIHFHDSPSGDSQITAYTLMSIPLDGSPALSFYRSSTGVDIGGDLQISAPRNLPELGDTAPGVEHLCIPAWLRGTVQEFTVTLLWQSNYGAADVILDNVSIVDDPACGTNPTITDPGFDTPYPLIGGYDISQLNLLRTVQDPTLAHSPPGVLVMENDTTTDPHGLQCYAPWLWLEVNTPPPSSGGGPAIAFYYKVPANAYWQLLVRGIAVQYQDGAWHREIRCLGKPTVPTGYVDGANFFLAPIGAPRCSVAAIAYIDDVSLTTDPSCP